MTEKILKTIEINKKLKLITFEELEYSYLYMIKIENDIYKFKMSSQQDCCEKFGWEYYDDTNKIIRKKKLEFNNFVNNFIDKIIYKIEIIHNTNKYDIILKFICENENILCIGFYNIHNGYYSHRVILSLFENGDVDGMSILNTYL